LLNRQEISRILTSNEIKDKKQSPGPSIQIEKMNDKFYCSLSFLSKKITLNDIIFLFQSQRQRVEANSSTEWNLQKTILKEIKKKACRHKTPLSKILYKMWKILMWKVIKISEDKDPGGIFQKTKDTVLSSLPMNKF
jgi:hypothetical protein